MTHCAAPRRPMQFYSNEPRGAVKSKRVDRKVNGRACNFRDVHPSHVIIQSKAPAIQRTIPLDIFHGNCRAIEEEKNGESNTPKNRREGRRGGRANVKKRHVGVQPVYQWPSELNCVQFAGLARSSGRIINDVEVKPSSQNRPINPATC